eukprot:6350484-Lingulodinium_polyedra.AAC.1
MEVMLSAVARALSPSSELRRRRARAAAASAPSCTEACHPDGLAPGAMMSSSTTLSRTFVTVPRYFNAAATFTSISCWKLSTSTSCNTTMPYCT